MLNAVIRFALRYRLLVVVASLVLLFYGSYLATLMPIDVFPDLDRPRVVIITECPGLAAEEVETLITQPIEIALLGANGVEAVRSQSTAGLNVIYVEFNWDVEVRAARQTVQERLTTIAGILPEGIRPQMTPTASIMGQIVIAGMYRQSGPGGGDLAVIPGTPYLAEFSGDGGEPLVQAWKVIDRHRPATWERVPVENTRWITPTVSPGDSGQAETSRAATLTVAGRDHDVVLPTKLQQSMNLRTTADWVVRPRLLKIPGVAEVFIQGGDHPRRSGRRDDGARRDPRPWRLPARGRPQPLRHPPAHRRHRQAARLRRQGVHPCGAHRRGRREPHRSAAALVDGTARRP